MMRRPVAPDVGLVLALRVLQAQPLAGDVVRLALCPALRLVAWARDEVIAAVGGAVGEAAAATSVRTG